MIRSKLNHLPPDAERVDLDIGAGPLKPAGKSAFREKERKEVDRDEQEEKVWNVRPICPLRGVIANFV